MRKIEPTNEQLIRIEKCQHKNRWVFEKVKSLRACSLGDDSKFPYVLFTACDENQWASEGCFEERYHGCFTYYLCKTMKKMLKDHAANITWNEFYKNMIDFICQAEEISVIDLHYTEEPQLRGTISKQIFATSSLS